MKIDYVLWRNGTAYYRRRIPKDVAKQYKVKDYLTFTLGTKDPLEAARKAREATKRLDREWALLRASDGTELATRQKALAILEKHGLEPGQWAEYRKHDLEPDTFVDELSVFSQDSDGYSNGIARERLPDDLRLAADLFYADDTKVRELLVPSFLEVKEKHLYFHPKRAEDPQFERSVKRFLEINGDMPINQYRREHGNAFVKQLLDANLKGSTIHRYLNQIRPIFNTAIEELEISMNNPLSKLKVPKQEADEDGGRAPYSMQELWELQKRCREVDDQRRWVLSIISDTGARLSEIAGAKREDVVLDGEVPHIVIKKNEVRDLKSASAKRKVPLVGEALWAAQRAIQAHSEPYLFPVLVKAGEYNNGSVSAALNKWLKTQNLRGDDQPIHSLRHSIRDRLRNAGYSPDIIDRIGGWKTEGVGERYGAGHDLAVLHRYMLDMIEQERSTKS